MRIHNYIRNIYATLRGRTRTHCKYIELPLQLSITTDYLNQFKFQYINGILVAKHEIGHLPFEADITEHVYYGKENRVTVLCDNALVQTTIPQGKIVELPT